MRREEEVEVEKEKMLLLLASTTSTIQMFPKRDLHYEASLDSSHSKRVREEWKLR
jgi:hypothetical protein